VSFMLSMVAWAGLAAGNFISQWLGECHWVEAFDKTFLQAVALLWCLIIHRGVRAMRHRGPKWSRVEVVSFEDK
jgi:hypothetical protein